MSREGGISLFRPCGRLYKVRVSMALSIRWAAESTNKYNTYP